MRPTPTDNPTLRGELPPEVHAALEARYGTILARFDGLDWADVVLACAGPELPADVEVTSSCALAVTGDGELVLVDVAKRGWDLPGGHVEEDESPLEALVRELREEAGLEVDDAQVLGWFLVSSPGETPRSTLMAVYRVDVASGSGLATQAPGEITSVGVFGLDDLPEGVGSRIWAPFVELVR